MTKIFLVLVLTAIIQNSDSVCTKQITYSQDQLKVQVLSGSFIFIIIK